MIYVYGASVNAETGYRFFFFCFFFSTFLYLMCNKTTVWKFFILKFSDLDWPVTQGLDWLDCPKCKKN